jgi:hypothetical protein
VQAHCTTSKGGISNPCSLARFRFST